MIIEVQVIGKPLYQWSLTLLIYFLTVGWCSAKVAAALGSPRLFMARGETGSRCVARTNPALPPQR